MYQAASLLCGVGIPLSEYKGREVESKNYWKAHNPFCKLNWPGKKLSIPLSKEFCLEKPLSIYIAFSKPCDVIVKIRPRHILFCQYSYGNVSRVQTLRPLFLLSVSNRAGLKSVFYNAYS
jgi:hypothetical protein